MRPRMGGDFVSTFRGILDAGWVASGSELGAREARMDRFLRPVGGAGGCARASKRDRMGGTWESPGPDTESDRLRFAR